MKSTKRMTPRRFCPGFFFPQRGQASASRAQLFWQCGQRGMGVSRVVCQDGNKISKPRGAMMSEVFSAHDSDRASPMSGLNFRW